MDWFLTVTQLLTEASLKMMHDNNTYSIIAKVVFKAIVVGCCCIYFVNGGCQTRRVISASATMGVSLTDIVSWLFVVGKVCSGLHDLACDFLFLRRPFGFFLLKLWGGLKYVLIVGKPSGGTHGAHGMMEKYVNELNTYAVDLLKADSISMELGVKLGYMIEAEAKKETHKTSTNSALTVLTSLVETVLVIKLDNKIYSVPTIITGEHGELVVSGMLQARWASMVNLW
eukprot:TRINITY_DN25960_c0_g1_i1.p1 TRINITY_DN25960_c0_g1~~TRINITY_DN25960_c0_g1_i1.p1  ORF type:complete len:228 (-),score=38.96 TRINITY_DN25960_c0_g1_i1:25-708(-)